MWTRGLLARPALEDTFNQSTCIATAPVVIFIVNGERLRDMRNEGAIGQAEVRADQRLGPMPPSRAGYKTKPGKEIKKKASALTSGGPLWLLRACTPRG